MVDAVDMTPGSDEWDTFFGHYPVMVKDGVEGKKLDRNDFSKYEDGTPADITSGAEGDVMIAFPRCGLKFSSIDNGRKLVITMTDNPNADGFTYMAHKRGDTLKDKFYLGAYKGVVVSNKLRSLSGKQTPTTFYYNLSQCRTFAQANGAPDGNGGSGYDLSGWYQLIYRQCMYVLKYRNLNSQAAVGMGATVSPVNITIGRTNTKGMDWGESTGNEHMKLFGIEDFWGNIYERIDGCYFDDSGIIRTATENFNDTGTGYLEVESLSPKDTGYMSQVETYVDSKRINYGFLPVAVNGSDTTYFCDQANLLRECIPAFGGTRESGKAAGAFNTVFISPSSTNSSYGARLMYV
jgi:hypothetical protein